MLMNKMLPVLSIDFVFLYRFAFHLINIINIVLIIIVLFVLVLLLALVLLKNCRLYR